MSIEAMKQALEALEKFAKGEASGIPVTALTNDLRTAIAEAEKQRGPVVGTKTWFEDGKVVSKNVHMADLYDTPPAAQRQPQDWSVFNTGAEVASGLSFEEAWEYMTPERLARGWSAVCVANKDNLPIEAAQRQPLTDEQMLEILGDIDADTKRLPPGIKAFARAIEAAHGITGESK